MVSRQSVVVSEAQEVASPGAAHDGSRPPRDLPVDRLTLVYLGIVLAALLTSALLSGWTAPRVRQLAIHAGAFVALLLVRRLPMPRQPVLLFLRRAYPLMALAWLYAQTAVLSQAIHPGYHDATVLEWDRWLFGGHPNVWLRERLPWPLLSEVLHVCYYGYIAMTPALALTLYFSGRQRAFGVLATSIMSVFYFCYLSFVLFPVKGPWYVFARPEGGGYGIFPNLVHRMLEVGASVGAAFPSSHVAASLVIAAMSYRFARRLSRVFIPMAVGIFFATVYGGFHYAVDALAGLVTGLTFTRLGPWLHLRLGGEQADSRTTREGQ